MRDNIIKRKIYVREKYRWKFMRYDIKWDIVQK